MSTTKYFSGYLDNYKFEQDEDYGKFCSECGTYLR